MSAEDAKKKIRKKRNLRKGSLPVLSYHLVESAPEEEIQRRIEQAFDILFSEMVNKTN